MATGRFDAEALRISAGVWGGVRNPFREAMKTADQLKAESDRAFAGLRLALAAVNHQTGAK